jgi:hypothetical protein
VAVIRGGEQYRTVGREGQRSYLRKNTTTKRKKKVRRDSKRAETKVKREKEEKGRTADRFVVPR